MQKNKVVLKFVGVAVLSLLLTMCKLPSELTPRAENKTVPDSFYGATDTTNSAEEKWKDFFNDPNLIALIDSALSNNQELNILIQEINVAKTEVRSRKGEYLPFLNVGALGAVEKVGRYTSQGASDASTDITPGKKVPDALPNFELGFNFSWEIDIWRKLRNARDAAIQRYLGSVEGKNFMVTHLVSEIAASYYELMALDNKLEILKSNIAIQQDALEIVKLSKIAAKVTELAVRKFEAEVLKNKSRLYYIQQMIVETENKINFLVGRFPQPIQRNSINFESLAIDTVYAGLPKQLFENRPDIKQAEMNLAATKLDVKSAKAAFYPSLHLGAGGGLGSFNLRYFIQMPESILFNLIGDLFSPLINRQAIKAKYYAANAKQIQAVYKFEQTILNAYIEVLNEVSNMRNLKKSFDYKDEQVKVMKHLITIANSLFKSARANYLEVLMTQRDALESEFELIEIKQEQLNNRVELYRALGGGWN